MTALKDAREILGYIHNQAIAGMDWVTDFAFWNGDVTNDREDGTVYVEHIIDGVDGFWTIGPIILNSGDICAEQYVTDKFDEAVKLLRDALSA